MEDRKILVIGAGPAGYAAAIRAAQLGAGVILVEEKEMGGGGRCVVEDGQVRVCAG